MKHHLRGEAGTEYEDYRGACHSASHARSRTKKLTFRIPGVLPKDFERFDTIAGTSTQTFPTALEPNNGALTEEPSSIDEEEPSTSNGKSRPKKLRLHAAKRPVSDALATPRSARAPLLRRRTSYGLFDLNPYESQGKASLPLPLVCAPCFAPHTPAPSADRSSPIASGTSSAARSIDSRNRAPSRSVFLSTGGAYLADGR